MKYYSAEVLYAGYKIYKNIIDISENSGFGKVVEKKIEIIQDTLEGGQLSAVKHANGRDWWTLVAESHSNRYYTMMLDATGLSLVDTQAIGDIFYIGLGQAVFSPDGTKYIRANGIKTTTPTELYIYDFDRCTGKLSKPIHLEYENWGFGTGCAISPNSRFLYAINASYVFQYDLEAPDIEASKVLVAEWDGYVRNGQFPTTFSIAQLAPDGKIYISCPNSNPYLHVIKYPNRKGVACEVVQRGIELPNLNDYSIPNFPNFRLGPIDGSACDTLGFDNHPLCNWRWEQEDTLAPLQVTFTDLSSYEPSNWHWDFGDGTVSQDSSPVHTYPGSGVYEVCLVVSNAYSADTVCQSVTVGSSSTMEASPMRFQLFPNPAHDWLEISAIEQLTPALFELYDLNGLRLLSQTITDDSKGIEVSQLPSGMYFYRIFCRDRWMQSGKVVVAR